MQVTIFYPRMRVHRADCADVKREMRLQSPDTTITLSGDTIEDILRTELEEDLGALGYTEDDYDLAPCVARTGL